MLKRIAVISVLILGTIVLISGSAYALSLGSIKDWLSGNVIAYILTGILAIGAIGGSLMFSRIVTTLQELGEFLTALGLALSDRKITKEELTTLLAQGKEVANIWRKTPGEFKVN